MKLIIGNKNYSSWSLRPWLLLATFKLDFEEVNVSLNAEGVDERLREYSATCKVPILQDNDLTVWDTLAICEYISEKYLYNKGWPLDQNLRAEARSLCAEVHSGFMALRTEMPMNCRPKRSLELSADAKADIARIDSIWSEYSAKNMNKEEWLFGEFSIADCFFAPIALRFASYEIALSESAEGYYQRLLAHPQLQEWVAAGIQEKEIIAAAELP